MTTPRPVLLDTDIATDPDDLLALLFIASSPEIDLHTITTTYGDTTLRARIAHEVCDEVGIAPQIATGPVVPISRRAIWYAGNEHQQLDPAHGGTDERFPSAVDAILGASHAYPGTLQIVAIGPLTNIALAVQADPSLTDRVDVLSVMGGDFADHSSAEHNLHSDSVAARIVFEAGFRTRVVGVDQTRRLPLTRTEVSPWIDDGADPLRSRLARDLDWWHRFNNCTDTLVHDPLAVAMITHPALFEFAPRSSTVSISATTDGRIVEPGTSRLDVVHDLELTPLRSLLLQRVQATLDRGTTAAQECR